MSRGMAGLRGKKRCGRVGTRLRSSICRGSAGPQMTTSKTQTIREESGAPTASRTLAPRPHVQLVFY